MCMYTLFFNNFFKTYICINTCTPSLTQYLNELKSKYKDELHQDVSYLDNMFLVFKRRLILSLASSYRIRESKFVIHYLIHCSLSSYSNSLSRNRSSESRYSQLIDMGIFHKNLEFSYRATYLLVNPSYSPL
jgi:hypothetical protein